MNLFDHPILLALVGGVALYFIARFLFRADEKIEDRRRAASEISKWCHSNGASFLCPLLDDYTVGDYSSMLHRLRQTGELIRNNDNVKAAMHTFLEKQLDLLLGDPVGRERFLSVIETKLGVKIPRELVAVIEKDKDALLNFVKNNPGMFPQVGPAPLLPPIPTLPASFTTPTHQAQVAQLVQTALPIAQQLAAIMAPLQQAAQPQPAPVQGVTNAPTP